MTAASKWWRYFSAKILQAKVSSRWDSPDQTGRIQRRRYSSYDAYVAHQRAKLERIDLRDYDRTYRAALAERLQRDSQVGRGTRVICLAARIGTEVKAFLDNGCFAIGIDLNPGPANHYVVHGDFHHLQFADQSVDVVFTNSLDHCYDVQRVLAEARRVLHPGGHLIVEAVRGAEEGSPPLFYESFAWSTIEDLVHIISANGFASVSRASFEVPWRGEHLVFRRAEP